MDRHIMVDDGLSARRWTHHDLVRVPDAIADAEPVTGRTGMAVPVRALLTTDLAWVTVSSADGTYRASIPATDLDSGGWLLIGSPDGALRTAEGGPFRLVVADGDTLCWNVKDVASLVATPERVPDSVPENPPH